MTRDEYMRSLDVTEASTALALELSTGATKRAIYRIQLDAIKALRVTINLGAEPWTRH